MKWQKISLTNFLHFFNIIEENKVNIVDIKTSVRLVSDGGFVFFVENISIRKQAVKGSAKMQTMRFDVKSLTWKIMKSPLARRLMTPSTK